MVKQMIRDCDVCQRQKPDLSAYPGLIQPLPIPERIWKEVSMDFIEKLPTSHGKSVILVVVDRLSKYAHFIILAHPFTASQVAQVFLDQVYKLHRLPESIVSDRDKVFLSNFWKALFAKLKVKLKLSIAYHPQIDGQTEVVNRSLGCYLRLELRKWTGHCKQEKKPSKCSSFHLKRSQDRIRNQVNKHRTDRQFEVGDLVYLKLQPHRQVSISQIHPVFHISQLKKCHGKDHSMGVLPHLREDGLLENNPMAILERRLGKVNNKPVMFVLIQWTNKSVEEATWEIYGDLITRFLGFDVFAKYQKINHTTSISAWFEGVSVKKDHLPLDDSIDLPCLSRSFVNDDVRPTFLRNDDEEMGLLDFVKSADPFKVKVGERTLAEKEVPLLTKTEDRAISPSIEIVLLVDHTIED
ncbi:retrotransposable element Tf2 [Tanacetum coccineum]